MGVFLFQAAVCDKGSRSAPGWSPPTVVNLPDTIVVVNEEDIIIDDGVVPVQRPPLAQEQRLALRRTTAHVVRGSFWQRVLDAPDSL